MIETSAGIVVTIKTHRNSCTVRCVAIDSEIVPKTRIACVTLRPLTRNGFVLWAWVRSTRRSWTLVTPTFLPRRDFPRLSLSLATAYHQLAQWPFDSPRPPLCNFFVKFIHDKIFNKAKISLTITLSILYQKISKKNRKNISLLLYNLWKILISSRLSKGYRYANRCFFCRLKISFSSRLSTAGFTMGRCTIHALYEYGR